MLVSIINVVAPSVSVLNHQKINAETGNSAGRGAISNIPLPFKPKAIKGAYKSWKESISQTGTDGHHGAFSRTLWKTASRNQKDPIPAYEEKLLAISPQVETSLQFMYNDDGSDSLVEESASHQTTGI